MRSGGVKLISLLVALIFAYGCSSSGGSAPPVSVTGKVAKGYVLGAEVHADKIRSDGSRNEILDSDELSTTSDEVDGHFTLSIPHNYGDYILVSTGGKIKETGEPAPKLRAPKNAKNITPITDLVVGAKDAGISKFEDAIPGWDSDIANTNGTDPKLLKLAFAVLVYKSTLNEVTETTAQRNLAMQEFALNYNPNTSLADIVENAINSSLSNKDIVPNEPLGKAAIATSVKLAVSNIINAIDMLPISEGKVVEAKALLEEAQAEIKKAIAVVDENANTARIKATKIVSKDLQGNEISNSAVTDGVGEPVELSKAQGEKIAKLDIHLFAINHFAHTKSYGGALPIASLIIDVADANSKRKGTAEAYDIEVTIAPTEFPGHNPAVTLRAKSTTKVKINGTNSQGALVRAELTGNTFEGSDLFSITSNILSIDLNGIHARVKKELGPTHDLFEVSSVGDHSIKVWTMNIPGEHVTQELKVNSK